jgi:DNA gyrase/topoisomerase IV subunit A
MSERTGLGLVEILVLQTLAELDARPDRPHQKSARVLHEAQRRHGLSHDFAFDALCTMTSDWLVPIRLVDGHGNFGSPDFSAAAPRYNEARLTPVGLLAVQSEAGTIPKLPLGLINGDMCFGGARPPFEPTRVIKALTRAIQEPRLDDEDLGTIVGPPVFPTGCAVAGEFATLRAGAQARLRLSATVAVDEASHGTSVVISKLPFGIGAAELAHAIAGRSQSYPGGHIHPEEPLPFRDVNDESMSGATRVVCRLREGADARDAARRVLDVWPVSIERVAWLQAPLGSLVRDLVDDDRAAQLEALERLVDGIRAGG